MSGEGAGSTAGHTLQLELVARDGPSVVVSCPAGDRVLDALDDARAPVRFGCRSATCGICLVEVLAGADLLDPTDPIEQIALEELEARPGDRLACRARAGRTSGLVRLRLREGR